jgi:hypothetical protein
VSSETSAASTGRRIDAHAERGFVAERDRFGLATAHQGGAGLRLVDLAGAEGDRLEVAVGAGRLHACPLEPFRHVVRGLPVLRAAGLAATHLVVGGAST